MKKNQTRRAMLLAALLLCFIVLVLCCSGCNDAALEGESNVAVQKKSNDFYDIVTDDKIYKDMKILFSCDSSSGGFGAVTSAEIYGPDHVYPYIPLLIAMHNNAPLLFELEESNAMHPVVYMQDIDGDQEDEIIVDSIQAASNRVKSVLYVLKVIDDKLEVLYKFPANGYAETDDISSETNNFGFTSRLMENQQLLVEYPGTDYRAVFDIAHLLADGGALYNSKGRLLPDIETTNVLCFESILVVNVQDIDGDGAAEIIGRQTVDMDGLGGNPLGSAEIIFKYQPKSKRVEVASVDFELNVS